MNDTDRMHRVDSLLSHVWMVRTFLKHSPEAEEDDELCQVHRTLYDYMLALGPPLQANDAEAYLKQARKKLSKLRRATEELLALQPQISTHTNFQMAVTSLRVAVEDISALLSD